MQGWRCGLEWQAIFADLEAVKAKVYPGAPLADACGNRACFDGCIAQIKVDGRRHEMITEDYHLDGEKVGAVFHAFDVLALGTLDLRPVAQIGRLEILDRIEGDFLKVPWSTDVQRLARYADAEGHEGIVVKLAGQPYGRGMWRKVKREETFDVTVVSVDRWKRSAAVSFDGADAGRVFNCPEDLMAGDTIEVVALEKTVNGCLRHGRFYRRRPDKMVNP